MKKLITFLLVALFMTACSEPLAEGTVINKRVEPANTFIYMMPIPHTTCSGGKNPICTTWYSYIPIYMYDDQDWVVTIQEGERTQDLYVTEERYACILNGERLRVDGECRTEDTHKELQRGHEQ